MKRKMASFFLVILVLLLGINSSFLSPGVLADENETTEVSEEECDATCKIKKANEEILDLKEKLKAAKEDEQLYSELITECGNNLIALNADIEELTPQIEELSSKIGVLETNIANNEKMVSELNNRVLTRMENAQGTMHFNPYLDFILGSRGFSDMLRRIYGIEAINEKEESDRAKLLDVIEELSADKKELDTSKAALDEKLENLEVMKTEQAELQALYMERMHEAEEEVAYYQNLYDNALENRRAIVVSKEELAELASLSGFSSPVPGSSISSGFPYYPESFGGGVHLGIDYAASVGTYLYAPADGVILVADDGHCDTYGYLGNSCGGLGGGVSYGGNQVYFICSVNDEVYALTFSHLYLNSVVVSAGDVVFQGDQIARVGSSGNSTGPHCHIEMFYLGIGDNEDLMDYIDMFNDGTYSLSFNCGWGEAAMVNNCDNNGYDAPCRLDGRNYLPG